MSTKVDTQSPVLVTGATGYVAGHIVQKLLDDGATVHAAVRDPENQQKVGHLSKLADQSAGSIQFFKTDLLDEGSYTDAMQNCEVVFHTASPFTVNVNDPQKELVDPAKLGTRNVLESANQCETVRRVVLTSSVAAIYSDCSDCKKASGGVLTEEIWNTTSSLNHQPYSYSKTEAEKVAWEIAGQQSRWKLVVINPSLVIGPALNPNATSESFAIVKQMGDGTMRTGAPRFGMGVVDVRDVADAHMAAAFKPDAEGRHIVSGYDTDLFEMAKTLLPEYGKKYPLPRWAGPKWLVALVAPLLNKAMTRRIIKDNVNVPFKADNSKSLRELGISYRPLELSMNEMFEQMIGNATFR